MNDSELVWGLVGAGVLIGFGLGLLIRAACS